MSAGTLGGGSGGNASLASLHGIAVSNPDGFSVTLAGKQPKTGYMVGGVTSSRTVQLSGPGGKAALGRYIQSNRSALQTPGAHLGGWTQPSGTVLDVSSRLTSRAAAFKLGVARNQISIWDVKRGVEIQTGGTGK